MPLSKKLVQIPLYVLSSSETFSAGAALVSSLRDRATIIGETTRGGGHGTDLRFLPSGYSISLPIAKSISVATGKGWETTGVVPDEQMDSKLSLEQLLKRLRGETGPLEKQG